MKKRLDDNNCSTKDLPVYVRLFLVAVVTLFSLIIFETGGLAVEKVRTVEAGDQVLVDFTCRIKDDGIVMTTDESLAKDKNKLKAGIFLPLKKYGPMVMIAGSGKKGPDYGKLKTFENEILENLSLVIVGMKEKSNGNFKITSEAMPGLTKKERFLRLSRIRRQPKSIKMSPGQFKEYYGKAPVPGELIVSKAIEGLSVKVISVTDDAVQVDNILKEGAKLDFPLGTGTVHDAGDHYETVIDMQIGNLIRTGVIVGRVVSIEGEMLTIDYGHPFGYESLQCDVTIRKIIKSE